MSFYEHFSEQELEILRERAERAAMITQQSDPENVVTALQLWLGSEVYAIPIESLRAVYLGIIVTAIPCTPAFVSGIANIRGRILPVLNLANLLHVSDKADEGFQTLVVVSNETMTIAFAIQKIGEVMTFSVEDIMRLPSNTDAFQSNYLRGVLRDGTGLLDIHAILADPNLIVVETFS